MPNWCSNTFAIRSKDEQQLQKFYNLVGEAKELSEKKHEWFTYCLYKLLGYEKEKILDGNYYYIRGNYLYHSEDITYNKKLNEYYFILDFESAWNDMSDGINYIIDHHFPGIYFCYVAEECGCDIYINTDDTREYFDVKYCVYSDKNGTNWFSDEDSLCEYIKKTFNYELSKNLIINLKDDAVIDYSDEDSFAIHRYTN